MAATTRMLRTMQQGRRRCDAAAAALLVATCIALSAITAPTPPVAAAAGGGGCGGPGEHRPGTGRIDSFLDHGCIVTSLTSVMSNSKPNHCVLLSKSNGALSARSRDTLVALAPRELLMYCEEPIDVMNPCDKNRVRGPQCLGLFRQGKSTFESSEEKGVDVTFRVAQSDRSRRAKRWVPVTKDCCDELWTDNKCLCQLKKQLIAEGKQTNFPCLQKKELDVCK